MLRNFPAKSSNLDVAEIKKEIKEISSMLQPAKSVQPEMQIFDEKKSLSKPSFEENLLGDLLFYLRTEKLMSTLMVCRQIEKIEVDGGVAMLTAESADITDLVSNEKYKQDLESFFKSKGLGFKIRERNKEVNPIEKLREIFGDKLIVK
ncbi:MAG: hypothetical protein IKJ33_00585 [Clostridia bacterium]|nr:hypothetical protein [Clostridia bacterium]